MQDNMKKCIFLLLGNWALLGLDVAMGYQASASTTTIARQSDDITSPINTRRAFLAKAAVTASAISVTATSTLLASPQSALAVDIKVTPVAHTFITSSGSPKPIRENDATRFFTNARVVYLFEGPGTTTTTNLAKEVMDLTVQRKADEGPGVTKGKVEVLSLKELSSSSVVDSVAKFVKGMEGSGDVVLVGPLPSKGTAKDGKLLADTAAELGTFVGGKREGGVISVLLDGPRQGLQLEEGGYPTSDLLWYSLPPKP